MKSTLNSHWKDWCWSWSSSTFSHLKWKADSLEKILMLGKIEGRRRGWQRMKWLDGIINSMDMSLNRFQEMVKDREAWCAAIHEIAKTQIRLSDWSLLSSSPIPGHISRQEWVSEVAQLCPTLCNPVDWSLPGSSIHGIFQARVLEWVAISFSKRSSLTQGLNPGLPHCRQTLYRLSHLGSQNYNSKRYMNPYVHSIIIHIAKTWKPKCPSRDEWVKMWYMYNGILFSHETEWDNALCSNMDGPRDYHAKWRKLKKRKINTIWYHSQVESNI